MRSPILAAAVLALGSLAAAACSRGAEEDGKERLRREAAAEAAAKAAATFDPERPATALALTPDDVARALGSFEWTAAVDWSVARGGDDGARVHATERHDVRQAATGEFEVEADVDPGLGAGSETGKHVIYAGGMTYAKARYAAFRERPTDHGRDARRFRDESFGVPRALAALYGDALVLEPADETTVAGRGARRYRLKLDREKAGTPRAAAPGPFAAGSASDPDTAGRRKFLDGRLPLSAEGELVLDRESGAPLRVRLTGAFGVKDDPQVRATVELLAQVKAIGTKVAAVAAPERTLPDERKASGVAGALEAAGLKKRGEEGGKPSRDEPSDESE